jgi:anti-anti-sigma factor
MFGSISPVPAFSQLRIDTTYPSPDTARAAVVGEVDLATAPEVRDRLLNVLRKYPPATLLVDLSGVTFLDCTGLGALIAVRNAAVRVDCHLRVTSPPPIVYRMLDLTGLLSVLTAPPGQPRRPVMHGDNASGVGFTADPVRKSARGWSLRDMETTTWPILNH